MILAEKAGPGIHEEVFAYFNAHFPGQARVLDCGAGTGAFIQRLLDAGYQNLMAVDLIEEAYRASAPFYRIDLSQPFSSLLRGRFDVITAIEVLEHLENPSNFLRECHSLLDPTGKLLITSPNVECVPARLKFFRTGRLRNFDEQGEPTHITPVTSYLLSRLAGLCGFGIEARIALRRRWPGSRGLIRFASACVAPICKGAVEGDTNLFLLAKSA